MPTHPSLPVPHIGTLPSAPLDTIADVRGVTVGHLTLADGPVQTGITVVRPRAGNLFMDRVPAAATVLNGFGKSVGLMHVAELGVLETPIALTNTFAVGAVAQAQIRETIRANPETGRSLPTVNPLVFECNDGFLNDIQRMALGPDDYDTACAAAGSGVAQGAVGAGRGMSCFGVKGGIGTASRVAGLWTVGALVLANFGTPDSLVVAGRGVGPDLAVRLAAMADVARPAAMADVAAQPDPEKGSIIMILATDAPLDSRQLRRLTLRAGAGLARTGSVFGHGSGDIALAFSTAYTVPQTARQPMPAVAMLHDASLDPLFRAAADSVEQAILHALWHAGTVAGREGHVRRSLREVMPEAFG